MVVSLVKVGIGFLIQLRDQLIHIRVVEFFHKAAKIAQSLDYETGPEDNATNNGFTTKSINTRAPKGET